MDNKSNVIVFNDFIKKFKVNQIGPMTFSFQENKITALLGNSGSGKTVIINTLLGIIRNYKGNIFVKGINRKSSKYYLPNNEISFYTQMDFVLYEVTAYQFLFDICLMFGINKKEVKQRIEYWMTFFDLWNDKDKKIKDYSWGMKNRVNLILCFIKNASIIILDEPGANLDSFWREKIKKLLIQLKNEGKTIIITVHNIDEISDIIDNYLIIDKGQLKFNGTKQQLNIYSKYKIFITDKFDVEKFRNFLNEYNIKSFKFNEQENSLVVAINNYKELNYAILYLIKENLPLKNLIRLPINMESIYKAIDLKESI